MKSTKLLFSIALVCLLALSAFAQTNQIKDSPIINSPGAVQSAGDNKQNSAQPTPTPALVKADEKAKEPPLTAIIPADVVKSTILGVQKDAQLAQQSFEILQLRIEKAQADLKKLQEDAQKAADAFKVAVQAAAAKVGVPPDALPGYEISTSPVDGAWILKKPPEKPKN
jgi:hypothetical protein